MSRKVEPGLWKLFDPARGTIWAASWGSQVQTTFHEPFARRWLAQVQSQNVTSETPAQAYADPADPETK